MPELPDYDMEGKEIRIFTQAWYDFRPLDVVDIGVEELTGDDFNDAAYNRNQRIQQNYNCEIVEISFKEHMNSFTKLCNTVYAADDAYDFCILESANLLESITSNILLDLKEVPYIDVEKPWWNSESYEAFSICGTNYAVCSDITTTDDLSVWNIYFNKDMIVDYNLDDPYELVRSGDWTYEKLFPMAKTVSDDLDGNNIRNEFIHLTAVFINGDSSHYQYSTHRNGYIHGSVCLRRL